MDYFMIPKLRSDTMCPKIFITRHVHDIQIFYKPRQHQFSQKNRLFSDPRKWLPEADFEGSSETSKIEHFFASNFLYAVSHP